MINNKINIIGASGTGKSTLAKAVAERIGSPHFDSNQYYHFPTDPPYRKQRSPEDRLSLLMTDLNRHSSWVLSGGLERLRQRERQLYGSRILSGGDMESDHMDFMKWSEGYDSGQAEGTNTLPRHEVFLKSVSCPVLRLESPMTTQEQVDSVLQKLRL